MNDVQALSSFKGHFLIAMPGLQDPNFFQTVVLLCEHNEDGALGVVINRVHPTLKAREIFEELKIPCCHQVADTPLHIGGPVHQGGLFILHGPPFGWEGTLAVTQTLALSNTLDLLRLLGKGEGPEQFMIVLGCAGWGPGQLDSEILENVWLTTPAEDEVIFTVEAESQWAEAIRRMGIDPVSLSSAAGHA
jgi:putative transcriptional regulator